LEWVFPHRVRYEAEVRTIDQVIENLLAQKQLIEHGAAFVAALIAGYELESVEVRVVNVSEGSWLVELLAQLYGTYQTEIESTTVGGVEQMLGVDVPPEWEPLVTLGSLAVVYLVARFAYDSIRGKKQDRPASTHIEGDYNTVVNVVASKLNLRSEEVEATLRESVPPTKRRKLLGSVTDFLNPARRQRDTKISVEGFGDISPETVAEYPSDADLNEIDATNNVDVPGARLEIRATDRDRSKVGWGAVIKGDQRFPRRLPMDLYPTVDADALANYHEVVGDVVVEGEMLASGDFRPKRIHLLNFQGNVNDDAQGSEEG